MQLKIWDTAGSERYSSVSRQYINGTKAALLIFDLTDPSSFHELQNKWIKELLDLGDPKMIKILIGNKSDKVLYNKESQQYIPIQEEQNKDNNKDNNKNINQEQIKEFCLQYSLKYFETSAKINKNISDMFQYVGEMTLRMYNNSSEFSLQNNSNYNNSGYKKQERANTYQPFTDYKQQEQLFTEIDIDIEQEEEQLKQQNKENEILKDQLYYDRYFIKYYSKQLMDSIDPELLNSQFYNQSIFETKNNSQVRSKSNSNNRYSTNANPSIVIVNSNKSQLKKDKCKC